MKLSYLLINIVLVGGGIFAYDTIKADDRGPAREAANNELLRADGVGEPSTDGEPTVLLDGGGSEILAKRNANRIATLEAIIEVLRRRSSVSSGDTNSGESFASTGGATMPALDGRDILNEDNPVFDDDTVKTIAAYIDEINRRKQEARSKSRLLGELSRLDLGITETQKSDVVATTLEYQHKARAVLSQEWPRDDKGRDARREAFKGLQDEYASTINRLVPEADAKKILDSRITRGMGFFGNRFGGRRNARGGRGGDGGNRNRNGGG